MRIVTWPISYLIDCCFSVKLINPDGGDLITQPGKVGEIFVRGPQVTIGYYNLPEKNKLAFDDEGFLQTGDLVTIDKEFNFYYFDRVQEFIRDKSGLMVSATELELIIAYQNATVSEVSSKGEQVQVEKIVSSPVIIDQCIQI